MKKGAIEFSTATVIVIILSVVAIGAGMILIKNILTVTELPVFQKGMPPFFAMSVYPEKGQIGTVFRINLELANKSGIYLIDARINQIGRIIKTIPLYDDGSHGDLQKEDGIYSNIWDSKTEAEGVYNIDIIINPSESQLEYKNSSALKIFKDNCEPLIYNGDPANKIDVAILPYGYSDLKQFRQDALQWITKGVLMYEPFMQNKEKLNFYIINQQNDFSCKRDESTRTLIYCDDSKIEKQASQCPSDQIIVILNDAEFCGTASSYVRACNGWNLRQVATHEFGHTFGGLGDEYSYSSAYPEYKAVAAAYPNCDNEGCGKWSSYEPGCFAGCGVDDLYRPTRDSCIMKKYTDVFCPVCKKHLEGLFSNYKSGEAQLLAAPPAEKTYLVDLDYASGNLSFKNVYATNSMAPDRKIKRGDYSARIVSFDGKELYSFNFELPNVLFFPPPQNENSSANSAKILDKIEWTILAPQFDNASRLDIYDKEKRVLAIDIGYLSNSCGNGKCEAHESAAECSQDCKPDIKDDLCNYAKDEICDPDCRSIDPDCRKINWLFVALIAVSLISILVIILSARSKKP